MEAAEIELKEIPSKRRWVENVFKNQIGKKDKEIH